MKNRHLFHMLLCQYSEITGLLLKNDVLVFDINFKQSLVFNLIREKVFLATKLQKFDLL